MTVLKFLGEFPKFGGYPPPKRSLDKTLHSELSHMVGAVDIAVVIIIIIIIIINCFAAQICKEAEIKDCLKSLVKLKQNCKDSFAFYLTVAPPNLCYNYNNYINSTTTIIL